MKLFKDWIIAHKLLSIVIAAVVAVGAATAIVLPIALRHEHTFATQWSQDGENHWHACTGKGCDEIKDKAAHEYTNACDADCNVCGATRTPEDHVYDNATDADCNVCGATREIHEHTFATEWSHDGENHWHACTGEGCDEISDKAEHISSDKHSDTQYWQECSVCGEQLSDKITATVDETTLANAIEFKDSDGNYYQNWQAVELNNKNNSSPFIIKFTGDAYYALIRTSTKKIYVNSYNGTDKVCAYYYKKNAEYGWIKTSLSGHYSDLAATAANNLDIKALSKETITYNKEDRAYYVTKLDKETETYKKEYTYKLEFVNGKLVSVRIVGTNTTFATATEEEKVTTTSDYTWTISYGNADIDIPSDLSVVGDAQWKEALSFDGVTNFAQTIKMPDRTITTKVTDNCIVNSRVMPAGADSTVVYYDITNKKQYSKIIKTGEKYTVKDDSSLTFDSALKAVGNPANRYSSIKNSFADFTYNADKKVYSIASATIDGSVYQNVELTFDNGKLVKVEYTKTNSAGNTYTTTITYTYGDTTVTIPSDSECIVPIEYDSTENSYKLENVSLKANEARSFVIDIKSTLFDTYKGADGKCEIGGEFTTSFGATFTITAKDANGNAVTNLATGNSDYDSNELVFKNLTAGKYFIEIKADADCTGAWDMGFNVPTPDGSAKEKAIEVPYVTSDGTFVLSDVALSAGDTWFVIDITQDVFDANSEDSKCEILGEFDTTDTATFTITVEPESGATIDNIASESSEFDCEISTYGKYYIKITASAACSGGLGYRICG